MKETEDEFFVGYVDHVSPKTRLALKRFVVLGVLFLIALAAVFALTQNENKNSSFELTNATLITGVYHESPYPMLQVKIAPGSYKNIVLLGFGKKGANPYLDQLRNEEAILTGKHISIEGNLIYYNGKTLLQITDEDKVTWADTNSKDSSPLPEAMIQEKEFKGEIIDPKCYFGVMKPGYGKIHRSCAVLCISGGIPPVLVTTDANNNSKYYLLTDKKGNQLHKQILAYVGKPSLVKGDVYKLGDWLQLRINIDDIKMLDEPSTIYALTP